jgi:hypothetical protein
MLENMNQLARIGGRTAVDDPPRARFIGASGADAHPGARVTTE